MLTDSASIRGDLGIPEESPHDTDPGDRGEGIVVLRSNSFELRKARTGDAREVVVFVVISSIVGDLVHPAVVRVSLLTRSPFVVLSEEMTNKGMEGSTKDGGEEKIREGLE